MDGELHQTLKKCPAISSGNLPSLLGDIAKNSSAPTYILLPSGIWCDSKRLLAIPRLGDAILWRFRRRRRGNRRRLRRKQRRLSRGISVRLQAKQDAQRHGDGDGQQRNVDEDADRHGWRRKNEGQNERLEPQSCGELNERASSRVAGMSAVEHDLAIDGFCLVGIAGGKKGFGPQRRFSRKERRVAVQCNAVDLSQRYEAPSGTGTLTCTCTRCLGRKYTRYEAGTSANSRSDGRCSASCRPLADAVGGL